jgi:curved DNA-binding protein CbpA
MSISINDYIKYDLYTIFLLTKENFSLSLLRKAYQRQILIYHPDKFESTISDEEKKEKYDTFNLINNAYTILSNEHLRNQYNEEKLKLEMEDTNFIDLKTQFNNQVKNKVVLPIDPTLENKFKEQMNLMNKDIQVKSEKISIELEQIEKERNESEHEILDYYKKHEEDFNLNLLKSETIKPSDNFTSELSNISVIRNTKVENNGTELYNSLYNKSQDDKYASLEEAYK